jgi:hypothetical protein
VRKEGRLDRHNRHAQRIITSSARENASAAWSYWYERLYSTPSTVCTCTGGADEIESAQWRRCGADRTTHWKLPAVAILRLLRRRRVEALSARRRPVGCTGGRSVLAGTVAKVLCSTRDGFARAFTYLRVIGRLVGGKVEQPRDLLRERELQLLRRRARHDVRILWMVRQPRLQVLQRVHLKTTTAVRSAGASLAVPVGGGETVKHAVPFD